jgi:hypothetical protein
MNYLIWTGGATAMTTGFYLLSGWQVCLLQQTVFEMHAENKKHFHY